MKSIIFDLYCSIICLTSLGIKASNSLESSTLSLYSGGIAGFAIIFCKALGKLLKSGHGFLKTLFLSNISEPFCCSFTKFKVSLGRGSFIFFTSFSLFIRHWTSAPWYVIQTPYPSPFLLKFATASSLNLE